MSKKSFILTLSAFLMAILALTFLGGCGEEESTTAFECDLDEPSLIPAPSGKPQHVYFFKDT